MNKITKSIGWAYPSSQNAETLGFVSTGCWHISQTHYGIEGSDQNKTNLPHNAEGYTNKLDPDLISQFHETDGEVCSAFLQYGDKDIIALLSDEHALFLTITDDTTNEVLSQIQLEDNDILDCLHYAKSYAERNEMSIDTGDGCVPLGGANITVEIAEQPQTGVCWCSASFFYST